MWDDVKALQALAATLAAMALAALCGASAFWLARQNLFAIREVVVTSPLTRTSAPHLEAVIREELAGTFFTMNLDGARASLASVPWVRGVALRRQWPPRLEIAIEEHVPLAHYGETALVNTLGETFSAPYTGALPRFVGPDGMASEMSRRYREWSQVLDPLALEIIDLAVSPRGGWRIRAIGSDGPVTLELGREEPSARLARFVHAYARTIGALSRQGTRIDYVDLRYRSAFAARVPGFREGTNRKAAS